MQYIIIIFVVVMIVGCMAVPFIMNKKYKGATVVKDDGAAISRIEEIFSHEFDKKGLNLINASLAFNTNDNVKNAGKSALKAIATMGRVKTTYYVNTHYIIGFDTDDLYFVPISFDYHDIARTNERAFVIKKSDVTSVDINKIKTKTTIHMGKKDRITLSIPETTFNGVNQQELREKFMNLLESMRSE